MRYISKLKKQRVDLRIGFNSLLQMWFHYHFFFFQSLIFRGLKLRAFSLFILIKKGLKMHEYLTETFKNHRSVIQTSVEDDFMQWLRWQNDTLSGLLAFHNFLSEEIEKTKKAFSSDKYNAFVLEEIPFHYSFWFLRFKFFFSLFSNFFLFEKSWFFFFKDLFFFNKDFFFIEQQHHFVFFFIFWFLVFRDRFFSFKIRLFSKKKDFKSDFRFSFHISNDLPLTVSFKYQNILFFFYWQFLKSFFLSFEQKKLYKQVNFFIAQGFWRLANSKEPLSYYKANVKERHWYIFFSFFIYRWLDYVFCSIKAKKYKKVFNDTKFVYDPSFIFLLSMLKITPVLILKPIPIGSINYDLPFPLSYWKRISYGCRWVINLIKRKQRVISVHTVVNALANSLWDEGVSMEKKDEVYSLVMLNRHLIRKRVMRR